MRFDRAYGIHGPTPAGDEEVGVSCFRARRVSPDHYEVLMTGLAAATTLHVLRIKGRPPFLVTGREDGAGFDGEPVLAGAAAEPLPDGTRVTGSGPWERLADARMRLRDAALGVPALPQRRSSVEDLARIVASSSPAAESALHGQEHWKRVAVAASRLIGRERGADPLVGLLFALFHDSMRFSDGDEPYHGFYGGEWAAELLGGGTLLSGHRLTLLLKACEGHDAGLTSEDPTVAAAWDSDRLNLWRAGVEPDPALLSTAEARRPDTIAWARGLQAEPWTWEEVLALYDMPDLPDVGMPDRGEVAR